MSGQFFGARGDAPIYEDAIPVATPVGQDCYDCGEPITDGDDGWLRPYGYLPDGTDNVAFLKWRLSPIHRECDLLLVLGHLVNVCPCNAEWSQRPRREQAREAIRRWDNGHYFHHTGLGKPADPG